MKAKTGILQPKPDNCPGSAKAWVFSTKKRKITELEKCEKIV